MEALLVSLGASYTIVNPRVWQKEIFKGHKTQDKKPSIEYCMKKYPNDLPILKISEKSKKYHDGKCDALCIALYGKGLIIGHQ